MYGNDLKYIGYVNQICIATASYPHGVKAKMEI
jgi:uncharacterized protein YwbE